jgi:hypothetical protein
MGNKPTKQNFDLWFIDEYIEDNIRVGLYVDPTSELGKKLMKIKEEMQKCHFKNESGYDNSIDDIRGYNINGKTADFYVEMINEPNIKQLNEVKMRLMKNSYDFTRDRFSFAPDGKTILFKLFVPRTDDLSFRDNDKNALDTNNRQISINVAAFKTKVDMKKREIIIDKIMKYI